MPTAEGNLSGVLVDSSENIFVAGNYRVGRDRFHLARYNSSGSLIWQRTLYHADYHLSGASIHMDSSGDLYIYGSSIDLGITPSTRALLVKYDTDGNFQWEREIYTTNTANEVYSSGSMHIDTNDGILVTGYTNDDDGSTLDPYVMKFNTSGGIVWQKLLKLRGPTFSSRGFAVKTDSSDNVYVTGQSWKSTQDAFVAKLNSSGALQWSRAINDTTPDNDWGEALTIDNSDNVVMAAMMNTASDRSIRLVRWDPTGSVDFVREFGGSNIDTNGALHIDSAGKLLIGFTTRNGIPSVVGNWGGATLAKIDIDTTGTFGSSTWSYSTDSGPTEEIGRTITNDNASLNAAAAGVFTEEAATVTEQALSLTEINYFRD